MDEWKLASVEIEMYQSNRKKLQIKKTKKRVWVKFDKFVIMFNGYFFFLPANAKVKGRGCKKNFVYVLML